jgi:hypothetical protein
VPNQTFTRRKADGAIVTVSRKAYTRRSTRSDAWRTPAQPPLPDADQVAGKEM